MRKFLSILGQFLFMVTFSAFVSIAVLEWLTGCGETYVDADGNRHQYECMIIGK